MASQQSGLRHRTQQEQDQSTLDSSVQQAVRKNGGFISNPFWLLVIGALAAYAFHHFLLGPVPGIPGQVVLTPEQLKQYGAKSGSATLYLAVLGQVFDVSRAQRIYGVDGSYSFFTGIDGSRAFISGIFNETGLTDDVTGLSVEDYNGLVEWRDFYHKDYTYVGRVVGRFYDQRGNPTQAVEAVEEGARQAVLDRKALKEEEKKIPTCNSKWSQKDGGMIWCKVGYPRKTFVKQRGSESQFRCACHQDVEHNDKKQLYKDCEASATSCITSPPAK
ncbi:hypothetical protein CYMTET_20835 [Cymbomonas tetramitiformis]|uniref:Cytochrome b5 heme-binding domain-containing protein n=1 Tax=Cymbomonas tetramitiformis TaxID=36881 RepID=A0AAE0L3H3_9CHLO|nr:hypothetical protein CYMTET_20835 [Cymbomonas tetramitiformis]